MKLFSEKSYYRHYTCPFCFHPVSPGKPLAMIGNKTMIQRVWEQARKSLDQVYVATDDERIFNTVLSFGGKAVITSADHKSGTDRCAEAVDKIVGETG